MQNRKVVISGGPGSGKTKLIELLHQMGFETFEEVSRSIIQKGFQEGHERYFKSAPEKFSELLFEGRKTQWQSAQQIPYKATKPYLFFDRGMPDTYAYLQAEGKNIDLWKQKAAPFPYDHVFLLAPWPEIYHNDAERLEPFDEAVHYYHHIKEIYTSLPSLLHFVPKGTPEARVAFILNELKKHD